MKDRNPYMALPAHVYLPALATAYIWFFGFGAMKIVPLIFPFFFFVLITVTIVAFYAKEKNLKKAMTQFVFLLVVLSPIIFLTLHRRH